MVGIKGWEMPKKCANCFFRGYHADNYDSYSWCRCLGSRTRLDIRLDAYEVFHGERPDFCPLVEVPDWHNVNYLLPLFGKEVLIYDDDTGVHLGFLSQYGDWETDDCTLDNVTHWQQITLPEK